MKIEKEIAQRKRKERENFTDIWIFERFLQREWIHCNV